MTLSLLKLWILSIVLGSKPIPFLRLDLPLSSGVMRKEETTLVGDLLRLKTQGKQYVLPFRIPPLHRGRFSQQNIVGLWACSQNCEKWLLALLYLFICASVRPSVHMEKLGSRWTECHEIWYLSMFQKSMKKCKFHEALFLLLADSPLSEYYAPTFRNNVCCIFVGGVSCLRHLWRWNIQSVPKHWRMNSDIGESHGDSWNQEVSLKSDKNNGWFTWRPVHITDKISPNSSQNIYRKCISWHYTSVMERGLARDWGKIQQ